MFVAIIVWLTVYIDIEIFILTIMPTNISNDKNASVQHSIKQETQPHCFGYVMYMFGNLALRQILGNPQVQIKER